MNFVSKGFTDTNLSPEERDSLNSETGFKLFVNKINKDQNFFCLVAPEWDIMYSPDLRKPILPGTSTSIVLARLDKDDSKFYLTTFNPSTDNPSTGSWDWFREEESNDESFYNYLVTLFNNLGDEYSNASFKDGKYTITLEDAVYVVGFNSESKLGYIKTSGEEIEITYPASVSFEETVPKITRFNKRTNGD